MGVGEACLLYELIPLCGISIKSGKTSGPLYTLLWWSGLGVVEKISAVIYHQYNQVPGTRYPVQYSTVVCAPHR